MPELRTRGPWGTGGANALTEGPGCLLEMLIVIRPPAPRARTSFSRLTPLRATTSFLSAGSALLTLKTLTLLPSAFAVPRWCAHWPQAVAYGGSSTAYGRLNPPPTRAVSLANMAGWVPLSALATAC